uniref:Uncharacterized protein n=1 Tax=Trichuris muris TaxID=70415 RepID=A0A5S6QQT9_TRIMR
MDDQNWESEAYVPGMLSMRSAWQGEDGDDDVKDNWFEDDEEEEPPKPPVTQSQPKQDSKSSNLKAGDTKDKEEKQEKQLTQKELEEIQKKSDLAIARETFNMGPDTSDALSSLSGDFDAMRKIIVEKVSEAQSKEGYVEFIEKLFHDLCANMPSESVRKIARNLSVLSSEISKIEKEKHKPKPRKKNTIAKLSRGGDFMDELKAGMDDAYEYYDDEDFM